MRLNVCGLTKDIKVLKGEDTPSKNLLNCTNIIHHRQLVKNIVDFGPKIAGVLKTFRYKCDGKEKVVEVDIIINQGSTWIKVKALKPEALLLVLEGNGYFGQKNIVQSCQELLECATQNPFEYKPPTVAVCFSHNVPSQVVDELKKINVVTFENLSSDPLTKEKFDLFQNYEKINCVNLDVTSLIFLCSDVTNGGAGKHFHDDNIKKIAEEELAEPSFSKFVDFLDGKEMLMTKTAYNKFLPIVNIVAGKTEQERAKIWLKKIRIIEDNPSERTMKTLVHAKEQHKIIFGTGDQIKAVTTTGNITFVRSAKQQNMSFSVYVHPARPFTEQKVIEDCECT